MAAALRRQPGVRSASINASRTEATVVRDRRQTDASDLVRAVSGAGATAQVVPTRVVRLEVENLTCDGCPERATAAVRRVPGTKRVVVRRDSHSAVVIYDTRRASASRITTALRAAGFPAHPADDPPAGR